MHTKQEAELVKLIHRSISHADDRFQRARTTEYKRIFGILTGALTMGLRYEIYSSLYRHVWECKFDSDGVDMEDPEQAELDIED